MCRTAPEEPCVGLCRVTSCAGSCRVPEVSCVGLFRMLDSVCRKCCRQCRTAVPSYARLADVERDDGALARHRRRQQRVVASGPQVRPRDARTPPPPSRRGGGQRVDQIWGRDPPTGRKRSGLETPAPLRLPRAGGNRWTKDGVEIPPREGKGPAWRRLTPLPPSRGGATGGPKKPRVRWGREGPGRAWRRRPPSRPRHFISPTLSSSSIARPSRPSLALRTNVLSGIKYTKRRRCTKELTV